MAEDDKVISCNWSELGLELLELILKRLALVDIARFKLVSASWYDAAKSYISSPVYEPLVPQTPWLLLPRKRWDGGDGQFFSLSEKKVYTVRNLFEGYGESWSLLGSSYGWLVMWDSKAYQIHLVKPISRVRIMLPPVGFPRLVTFVILSSDPSTCKTFYVVIIYSKKEHCIIAFHKHGDDGNATSWTDLDGFRSVFFHNSLLFGMCTDSKSISVWDLGATHPIKTMDFQPPERKEEQGKSIKYFLESKGELLFVEKLSNPISHQFYYDIHKLNFTPNKVICLKVQCLQDQALVLGEFGSTSISLSTVDFPELEANSIYVAKNEVRHPLGGSFEMYSKVEAYNLENKDFKSFFTSSSRRSHTLFWIVPNPCEV